MLIKVNEMRIDDISNFHVERLESSKYFFSIVYMFPRIILSSHKSDSFILDYDII